MNPSHPESIAVLRSRLQQKDYYQATTLLTNFIKRWGYVAAVQFFKDAEGNEQAPGVWQAALASLKNTSEEKIVTDVLSSSQNCHLMNVAAAGDPANPGPPFTYTVGLWHTFWHPEMICIGLPAPVATQLLGFYTERIAEGKPPKTDVPLREQITDGYPVQFKVCRPEAKTQYMQWANWFNSTSDYPVVQLIWQDKNNRWPWDKGFHPPTAQPLLLK